MLGGGRAAGLRVADIVGAVTSATGLDGEAVRDVSVLERFSFLSVPSAEADRVIEALSGEPVARTGPASGTRSLGLSVPRRLATAVAMGFA